MLVGGSPAPPCGFKVTTLAVLLLSARAVFFRRGSPSCFGRRFQDEALRSASAIFLMYLVFFLLGGTLICCIDGVPCWTPSLSPRLPSAPWDCPSAARPDCPSLSPDPDLFDVCGPGGRSYHDLRRHIQFPRLLPISPGAGDCWIIMEVIKG